ncbi:hypothetical protein CDL12_11387 [Handroanthus impetiginosus]|uniref:Response regulatory domain-containing protein n=1 Tax=Handroanthus impetiginosus TaxID=429701 RepID=A0A2G9HFA3_9LAMI|nr:hypothetical protein CDL12_11387 [Handroanthus impetiginosus]
MLSEGNVEFDVVMVNVSSSDLQGFNLVHEAINMGSTVILMSANANATLVKCAIEDGAFLFMEKPISVEELKYLWQHVLRGKTRKSKEKGRSGEASSENHNQNYHQLGRKTSEDDNSTNEVTMNQYISTCQKGQDRPIGINSDNTIEERCMRPKMCTEWTPELHERFMDAVRQLGDGRCFPKDILELMNVPGLTRMQVASHLQKCRYGWQPPHERQTRRSKASKRPNSNSHRPKAKRYGLFPNSIKGSQPQMPVQDNKNYEKGRPSIDKSVTHNMGQEGTWDSTTSGSNNSNMNEISSENEHGNMLAAFGQGLQSDASFDFDAAIDGLVANNFDLQCFDYDHDVSGQTSDAANQESDFWSSWISNFARDS